MRIFGWQFYAGGGEDIWVAVLAQAACEDILVAVLAGGGEDIWVPVLGGR